MSSATILADGSTSLSFDTVRVWFNDPSNWWGPQGLLALLREHIVYTVIAVVVATAIALPLGLLIGHTGRGVALVGGLTNGMRAIPTLGFVVLLVVWISPQIHIKAAVPGLIPRGGLPFVIPIEIVLIVLAIPAILTNTYAGVQNVDPVIRDAATGMGMTGGQVVRQVEVPIALPLIISGIRSATLQVIATATVAAYVPFLGGLGQLIINGAQQFNDPQHGYPAMVCAGITVAVLAMLADFLLALLQRVLVSPGVSGRFGRASRRSDGIAIQIPEVLPTNG
ncbi:osmoprotectant transport system permease protein [Jatrophihabitans sp. GAS493]|uniref:ABC transporter permease n=1 Tax=Jatrophihabitans sp. GAS493 TaxID=1907575 RepID=UPI000BB95FC4|nr:ABC transporter permease [Jatrophihabitans sp. GAS493]SOD71534.1 osmoprotectant transport system permease protein [Jatrophihabitans sp. GAS493]